MPVITVPFSSAGMKNLKSQLTQYKRKIDSRTELFVKRLANAGIAVGKANRGEYAKYIVFTKEINSATHQTIGIVKAAETEQLDEWWWYGEDSLHGETISPLLMAEFGSGKYASIADDIYNGIEGKAGRGTLNIYGHAFDDEGWWWTDLDGELHHSKGETPTYPVYSAYMAMHSQIKQIAKETFK